MSTRNRIFYTSRQNAGLILLALLLVGASIANAQSADPESPIDDVPFVTESTLSGGAECFDYYTFQSVQVAVGAHKDVYTPGNGVLFQGELINENSHPIVDGNVFVRISKDSEKGTQEGYPIVDEFLAQQGISLGPNEKMPIKFGWSVPEGLPSGDYQASFFFSVGKRFNLSGLPFTNEVIGGLARFSVSEGGSGAISFDRSQTMVNGEAYQHIGAWPLVPEGESVEISQPIVNTTNSAQEVAVTYDLFYWDSLNAKDLLLTKKEDITVPAGGTRTLSYDIPSMDDSVYYLRITAATGDVQSIVNIRVTADVPHLRLNYPALTSFPLQEGEEAALFSCFHNTSYNEVEGAEVEVSVQSDTGELIAKSTYEGAVGAGMMAAAETFTSDQNYNYAKLVATISDSAGNTIDEYEVVYDCEDFDACIADMAHEEEDETLKGGMFTSLHMMGGLGILILIVLAGWLIMMRSRKDKTTEAVTDPEEGINIDTHHDPNN